MMAREERKRRAKIEKLEKKGKKKRNKERKRKKPWILERQINCRERKRQKRQS